MKITEPLTLEAVEQLMDKGSNHTFEVDVPLYSIVNAGGADGFNDMMEGLILGPGCGYVMSNLVFTVIGGGSPEPNNTGHVVIRVEAELDEIF